MKLIVQIPAFNEESTIAQTLRDVPKKIDGIIAIETIVIDDGSSDNTADAARTNAPTRPSRLYRGLGTYLRKSIATIFRIYTIYKPLKTFFAIGAVLMLAGSALGIRFLWDFTHGDRGGHIQSLILAAVFLIIGFQTLLIALIADLISVNRRLSEEVLVRMKRMEMPVAERRPLPHRAPREARPATTRPPLQKRVRPERPEAKPPSTQWVWLLDEDKLQDRRIQPAPITEPDLD